MRLLPATALCFLAMAVAFSATTDAAVPIPIGTSVITLNGPWRFHTGDDPRWSGLGVDDSGWKQIDLSASQDSHDPDVGLTGFVAGWTNDGYPNYSGYAWYRMRIAISASRGTLAIAGPPLVDDAYQLYFNGRLLGGSGDFSRSVPITYSTEPKMFPLEADPVSWRVSDWTSGGLTHAPLKLHG